MACIVLDCVQFLYADFIYIHDLGFSQSSSMEYATKIASKKNSKHFSKSIIKKSNINSVFFFLNINTAYLFIECERFQNRDAMIWLGVLFAY